MVIEEGDICYSTKQRPRVIMVVSRIDGDDIECVWFKATSHIAGYTGYKWFQSTFNRQDLILKEFKLMRHKLPKDYEW